MADPNLRSAFKVMSQNAYIGKLTYFTVYSGHIKASNTTNGRTEHHGRILQISEPPRGARGGTRRARSPRASA